MRRVLAGEHVNLHSLLSSRPLVQSLHFSSLPECSEPVLHQRDLSTGSSFEEAVQIPIYELDPLSDTRWAEFVEHHPSSSVFHSVTWLQALQATYGFTPVAYTDSAPGEQIRNGQVFCHADSWITGKRVISVPFSDHVELLSSQDETWSILEYLKKKVDHRELRYFEVRSECAGLHPAINISARFFHHKIDLQPTLAEIYKSFHVDCIQRKIRRAEREALSYSVGTDNEHLNDFYSLLLRTHARHHTPPQSIRWFRNLRDAMGDRIQIRLAKRRGVPIAGMITLSHRRTLTFKYGCSDAAFHKLGGVAMLFWESIKDAKERGMQEFDLGRCDPQHQGLMVFKEHWGAKREVLNYYRYPSRLVLGPRTWEYKLAESMLSMAPAGALRVIGALLYKHMA